MVFRLNFGQISFNLVENLFATQRFALLATSIAFYYICLGHAQKSKAFLSPFLFSPFLFFLLQ